MFLKEDSLFIYKSETLIMQLSSLKPRHWCYRFWNRVLNCSSPFLLNETYLKIIFRHSVDFLLNLEYLMTFNKKLDWLKMNYCKPELSKIADKYEVKKIMAKRIGEEYEVPYLGLCDSPKTAEFDYLQYSCVIRLSHQERRTA